MSINTSFSNPEALLVFNTSEYPREIERCSFICFVALSISTLGVLGNVAFLFVVIRVCSMQTVTNAYLVNLAFADLLHLVTHTSLWLCGILADPCPVDQDTNLPVFCVVLVFSRMSQYVSMFTVTVLSLERYVAVCRPIVYRNGAIHRPCFVATVIGSTWLLALLFSSEQFSACIVTTGSYYHNRAIIGSLIFIVSLMFLMTIVTAVYVNIICRVRASTHSMKSRDKQIIRICIATACIYFICMLPSVLQAFMIVLNSLQYNINNILEKLIVTNNVATILLEVNSSINPIVYNALSSNYRSAFSMAFKCSESYSCFFVPCKEPAGINKSNGNEHHSEEHVDLTQFTKHRGAENRRGHRRNSEC
ncbi:somatostatin receptor type 2-like [Saccoglossus kowalevskii]|uniref:Somatostatin receptor type 4-like n=1 Tax=Saccoglossus kowalevskii TaxID=10224 RepID=A0ABM0MLW6_SACKO|nr:PREDICTED: somatostatin receptor type 4-like [Saccoglossus kowalevskii]